MNLSFAPKAVGAVSSVAALVCGSTFLYYESLPKDWKAALSREGIVLLSSDSENAYKAIYLENKDFLNVDLGIDISNKEETEAIKEIQKWCDAELNQEYKPEIVLDREKVIKY
ncbi:hypothetical protein, partial [Candidatus Mycoplasma haematohominis]|uniref:hypothetical protein n=1 Tax=Candidatus Mycoplasma haematohominis TaxID=1494318 RepID=UPI001C0A73EC